MTEVPKRMFRTLTLAFLTSVGLWLALVSFAQAEVIRSFDAAILVQSDGSLRVTETILYDFESASRHGIFRNIKNSHAQPASAWYKDRYTDLDLVSVTRDGVSEPYTLEPYQGLSVKIGDPDLTITGPHTYEIVYVIDGSIATYDTSPEIYWNVTGDEWAVSIEAVEVTVTATEGVTLLSEQACYKGVEGATDMCDTTLVDGQAVFLATEVFPGEGMTIAQRLELSELPTSLERYSWALIWFLMGIVWLVSLSVWLWRWRIEHKDNLPVIAQYEPYQDFKPMFTGVLFDNRLDSRDIAAGIVYLAEQGFLTITQTNEKVLFFIETSDYEITLLRSTSEVETAFQKELLKLLGLKEVGQSIKLSEVKGDQSKLQENAKIIRKLKKAVIADLVKQEFIEQRVSRDTQGGLAVLCFVLAIILVPLTLTFLNVHLSALLILLLISAFLLVLFRNERRLEKGYEARNHLRGFKDFLSTTEKERYKFHNAPERNAKQFMEYLPFAIAFGVEKEWSEVFKDIQIDSPSWYHGANNAAFSAVAFSSDLSSFTTAFASSTTPSGNSGSGGGGFSGGGGGGGGGGSW